MESGPLKLVEGTAALAPSVLLEAELAKDTWDARNIPGLRYAPHTSNYLINFTGVPAVFRPAVKEYAKFQLASGRAAGTLHGYASHLGHFLTFFVQRSPSTATLQDLNSQDINDFIITLKATLSKREVKDMNGHVWYHIHALEGFLAYLERIQSPLKPTEPTARIIWPQHFPRRNHAEPHQVKYIPQSVLRQLDAHLQHLSAIYIPVVIILRASGWRISDVLYLKLDTCLEQLAGKYWLVGDIQKTQVLGHKIPITKEVAAVVLAQIEWVKKHYTPEENPHSWLFPAIKNAHRSQRYLNGSPLLGQGFSQALNRLAARYQIRDEKGEIFHFKSHAFRHTKAVELINNGMSLVMVQQWMAHASPEMTLIYAKILDETMRTQWEQTVKHGIVQFNEGRPEYVDGKKMLTVLDQERSFEPERVREHRANIRLPLGTCTKTPKLVCKFTELPCFHCPAYVLTPEDLPALEAYEQQILERIEIGNQAGNAYWIEVNQKNLDERLRPAIALLRQGQTIAKSGKYEREYTPDEWEQRQGERENIREETT